MPAKRKATGKNWGEPTASPQAESPGRPRKKATPARPGEIDPPRTTAAEATSAGSGEGPVIVGIGGSAGGFDALGRLLPGLPGGVNLAYVIALRAEAGGGDRPADRLAGLTPLEIVEARGQRRVEPDKIYLAAAAADLTIAGGVLSLRRKETPAGGEPSLDLFFASLAEDQGERAVGVLLSGAGSDGAGGLRAIKAGGGLAIVQEPTSAAHDGLPRAALAAGGVDLVLPPEKIGPELAAILGSPLLRPQERALTPEPKALGRLLELTQRRTGCDFSAYKANTIHRRVGRRVALHKLASLGEYLALVEKRPEDLDALAKDILISVTGFFRDEEAFTALSAVIARIIQDKQPGEGIRVWVPGCATGEEAYSLALLFAARLGEAFEGSNLQIFGTDIDSEAIFQARRGAYPEAGLAGLERRLVDRFFRREGGSLQAGKAIRERIVFAKQDLVKDPPFSRIDLISCRNLLIYLNSNLQRRIIPLFHYTLNPGGYLFLGKSESIGPFHDLFEPVVKKWRIFRRKGTIRGSIPLTRLGRVQAKPLPSVALGRTLPTEPPLQALVQQAILEAVGWPAALLDERGEVVYVHGDVSPYLRLADGQAGLNIADLAPEQMRASLRAATLRAARERRAVVSRGIRLEKAGGQEGCLNLHVRPVDLDGPQRGLSLVLFEEVAAPGQDEPRPGQPAEPRDQRVIELEQELAAHREHLETITEELETANEELQSLNEELQSANEELQSSNEELETSNEELQAANEELITVNEELQVKTTELHQANADLENILRRMSIPLLVVDEELRVKRFTPAATEIFNLLPHDRGRLLTNVRSQVDIPDLLEALTKVVEGGEIVEREVDSGTKFYEMKAFPHVDEDGRVRGAILTFYDQSEPLRREQEFRAMAENSPDIVARFDKQLRYRYVNKAVEKAAGVPREACLGRTNRDLGLPRELCAQWETTMRWVFASGEETTIRFALSLPRGKLHFESRVVPEFSPDGAVITLLAVSRDITALVEAEEALGLSVRQKTEILESISDGFFTLDENLAVTYLNQAAGRLLGVDPSMALGRPFLEAFPEMAGSIFEEKYRQALQDRQALEFETYFSLAPYVNWYYVRVYPFQRGVSVYFQVVTEKKKAEEDKARLESQLRHAQKMEAVGALAGGVAHNFNNILGAIMGYAELSQFDEVSAPERRGYLQQVLAAAERGRTVVRQIVEFSRKTAAEKALANLGPIVTEALSFLQATLPATLEFQADIEFDAPPALVDPAQIQQLVVNLGHNAAQAMTQAGLLYVGLATVELVSRKDTLFTSLPPGRYLRLTVSDTGAGIAPDDLGRIFEPFFTTREVGKGSGLGLAVVHNILEAHQGGIVVESRPGQGSTFTVFLPAAASPGSDAAGEERPVIAGGDERILLVEDEEPLAEALLKRLSRLGYRVTMSTSPLKALHLFERDPAAFDLVVTDMSMPRMSGAELAQRLLAIRPEARVILCTGFSEEISEDKAQALGIKRFLLKPLSVQELAAAVRETLDQG